MKKKKRMRENKRRKRPRVSWLEKKERRQVHAKGSELHLLQLSEEQCVFQQLVSRALVSIEGARISKERFLEVFLKEFFDGCNIWLNSCKSTNSHKKEL